MKRPVYMAYMPSMPPDQGYSWLVVSFIEYLKYKTTGEYKTRIDWYNWFDRG